MEAIAEKKVHFAPYARQARAIDDLVASGEVRNVAELMRIALDHYLSARGRPTLVEQARQMADDFHAGAAVADASSLQASSMATDEEW